MPARAAKDAARLGKKNSLLAELAERDSTGETQTPDLCEKIAAHQWLEKEQARRRLPERRLNSARRQALDSIEELPKDWQDRAGGLDRRARPDGMGSRDPNAISSPAAPAFRAPLACQEKPACVRGGKAVTLIT